MSDKGFTRIVSRHVHHHWLVFLSVLLLLISHIGVAQFVESELLSALNDKYGETAFLRGEAVNRLIDELKDADEQKKIIEVNRFFNQFTYQNDTSNWGVTDYWATPFEFLGKGSGDCEDYVISKYFVLRQLGVHEKKLYLTYVKQLEQNVAHMVLSYFETPTSIPLVLDNYNPYVRPADQRSDLSPVYSFNANKLFLSKAAGLGKALPTDKIKNSQWDQLLQNLERSKF